MTNFLIRSMSTTDYVTAYRRGNVSIPAQQPVPYHVYLMPVEKRHRAFWNRWIGDAMTFQTEADAQREIDRCGLTSCDIVPVDHERLGVPTYWDRQQARRNENRWTA